MTATRPQAGAAWPFIVVLLLSTAQAVAAAPAAPRVVLRTGDRIPRRGTIGTIAAVAQGIDAQGRVLVASSLADGSQAIIWADAGRLEVLWRSAEGAPRIDAATARSSASGAHVVALADPTPRFGAFTPYDAAYAVGRHGVQRRLGAGDVTLDGWMVVAIEAVGGVADDGSAAVLATIRRSAGDAAVRALLSLTNDGARVLAGDSDALPLARRFSYTVVLAVLPGGAVVFNGDVQTSGPAGDGIYRADAAAVRPVLRIGDPHPAGGVVDSFEGWAASDGGDVLLLLCAADTPRDAAGIPNCPIYRSAGAQWIRVRDRVQEGPAGRSMADGGALNGRGDVAIDANWLDPEDPSRIVRSGVLFYPSRGAARLVGTDASVGFEALNAAGELAVETFDGEIGRWSRAGRRALVSRDSRLADGTRLIGGGITGEVCLASDNRIGARASFVDGGQEWVCVDDNGAHVLPRTTDSGESVDRCAFAGDELAVLSGGTLSRASGGRASAVLRRGDSLPDGGTLVGISDLTANAAGMIAAVVSSTASTSQSVIRQARGGAWEAVPLGAPGAEPPGNVVQLFLGEAGDLAVMTGPIGGHRVVVAHPDGTVALLAADFSRPERRMTVNWIHVGGDAALVFSTEGPPISVDLRERFTLFDLRTGAVRAELDDTDFDGATGRLYSLGLGADGSMLIGDARRDGPGVDYWLVRDGAAARLDAASWPIGSEPAALTSSSAILFRGFVAPSGAWHSTLATTAPEIAGRCPAAQPASSGGGGSGGCQVAAPGDPTAWPAAAALALVLWRAARRRRS